MPSLLSDKKDIYIFVRMLHQTSHQIHSSLLKRKAATLVSTLPLKQGNRNKNPQKLYVATWLAFSHSRFDPDSQPKKTQLYCVGFSARGFPIFKGKHFNCSALLDLAARLRTLRNFLNPVKTLSPKYSSRQCSHRSCEHISDSNLVGILWL
jgi:hypothetical protein